MLSLVLDSVFNLNREFWHNAHPLVNDCFYAIIEQGMTDLTQLKAACNYSCILDFTCMQKTLA